MLNKVVSVLATVALAVTFVAAGFGACAAFPQTTELLANMFSGTENPDTPFSHDDLVTAAVQTRDYTVGSNDRDAVFSMLHLINKNADTRYAESNPDELGVADEEFTLTADALSHLDDVYGVVVVARTALIAIAIAALIGCLFVGIRSGKRALGGMLLTAGAAVIIVFAALAVWVVVDFNGFFTAFHSLFFANGTWTFSWDSLLITMYPPEFWIGMGAVWLVVTGLLSLAAVVVGTRLRHRTQA